MLLQEDTLCSQMQECKLISKLLLKNLYKQQGGKNSIEYMEDVCKTVVLSVR